ncbi:SIR2 family protein [Providencia rettgeri]|uniref:SIR2 family protein n=1 Tax=Providencia TaxID=586 RepID=UPI0021D49231|nr:MULTISPECIES: SIR2 family protein [Providencia]WIE08360.1 SIR2 family protein [Providencia rettgeri]
MSNGFDFDGTSNKITKKTIASFESIKDICKGKKVCIFLGAGFSMAWDRNYPSSDKVFTIGKSEADEHKEHHPFFSLSKDFNIDWVDDKNKDNSEPFKLFKYNIDIYKRYPSLLPSHLDGHTVSMLEDDVKIYIKNKFKEMVGEDNFCFKINALSDTQNHIVDFFEEMQKLESLDIITTNYDVVIDNILNRLKGKRSIIRGVPVFIDGKHKCPQSGGIGLYKLNGGFEVIEDGNKFRIDYDSILNEKVAPNIILPSKEQNYSDKYFKNVFIKSSSQLRNADIIIFIGYSFPKEDLIINFLLKSFLDSTNKDKEIIIMSRNSDSAKKYREKAISIFKELYEIGALHYLDASFTDMCKNIKNSNK